MKSWFCWSGKPSKSKGVRVFCGIFRCAFGALMRLCMCFCPIHDKVFELGYISLDSHFRICVEEIKDHSKIFKEHISRYIGMTISKGYVESERELVEHRLI